MVVPWFEIFLIPILILINGLFSCAEIAVISSRKTYIQELSNQGDKRAKRIEALQKNPERFLATIQIGITVVGASAAALGGVTAIQVVQPLIMLIPVKAIQGGSEAFAIIFVVAIVSYLTLILGELVPKSIALRSPDAIALWVGRPIERLAQIASPFIKILTFSSRLILKPLGLDGIQRSPFVSKEEIKSLLKEGRESGVFDTTEQELIHSVFEFADISVKEVMVPRPKIHAFSLKSPLEEVLKEIDESRFARYPVYEEGLNDIKGILYYKDLLGYLVRKESVNIADILHSPYFVPETMKVSHLLKELQRRRLQIAIVINEYGSVEGLVTMEDLIEEIVGEIQDEYDEEEKPVEQLKDGAYLVDASLSIRDLKDDHQIVLPESPDYETLGGFILSHLQNIPRNGEIIRCNNFKITILHVEGRRVAKVKMEKDIKAVPTEKASSPS